MSALNVIKDETYSRLARRAAALNMTVEDLVETVLDDLAASDAPANERTRAFDDWMSAVEARSSRYPSDFVVDASRESIYEDGGE